MGADALKAQIVTDHLQLLLDGPCGNREDKSIRGNVVVEAVAAHELIQRKGNGERSGLSGFLFDDGQAVTLTVLDNIREMQIHDIRDMFSGLVRCADCGEKLYYCTSNSFETRQDHFVCSTSRKKGKEVCDTHFIRAVVLEEGTLQHMRLVIQCVADYEDTFRRALGAKRSEEAKKELSAKKRTLQKSENRLAELDRLFKRIYEDMVNGKLSEARFQMLSDDYEQEQADLRAKIEMLENEIQNQEDQAENVDRFIRQAKKYLYLEKLTPTILNDMVNAVYVHAPDKSSGHRVQDVTISYNYIGILPANLLYDVMNGKAA